MPERFRISPLDWLTIAAVAAVGAAACAVDLSHRSLWLDEGASLSIASQHGEALWKGISHDGGNMLIYYLALHVVIAIFGDGEVALRMISLLADAVTAGLVALLALRLFASRGVALVSGLLSAISIGLVFWGQDARGYAVMVTAVSASFYALVVLLQSDPRWGSPVAAVIGYVLATTLSLYIGFDAVLLIPAQLALVLIMRRRVVTLVCCVVVIAALSVPLVVLAINRGSSQLFWVPSLSFTVLWQALATLVSSGLPPNFHTTLWTVVGAVVASGLTLAAIIAAWRSRWGGGQSGFVLVPLFWLVIPAVLTVLGSLAGEPLELARISILMMPALSLLFGWVLVGPRDGLAAVPGRLGPPRVSLPLGVGVLGIILALRLIVLIPSYHATPEPWKLVAARVLAQAKPTDCIAFYPEDGRMPFGYYVEATPGAAAGAPRSLLPAEAWTDTSPHVEQYTLPPGGEIAQITDGCKRVWLVSSHQGQQNGPPGSRRNYAGYLTIQKELASVYAKVTESKYGYASTIHVFLYHH